MDNGAPYTSYAVALASWDCNCLAFKEYNDKLQQRNQEANMHFYPSSKDPQSWEATSMTKEDIWTFAPLPPPDFAQQPTPHLYVPPHPTSTPILSDTSQLAGSANP